MRMESPSLRRSKPSAMSSTRSLNSRNSVSFRAIRSSLADTGAFSTSFRPLGRWKRRSVGLSAERAAQNEARFREANEQIQWKVLELGTRGQAAPYLCECDDTGCTIVVLLTVVEYEEVRSESRWFLVAPGHENP